MALKEDPTISQQLHDELFRSRKIEQQLLGQLRALEERFGNAEKDLIDRDYANTLLSDKLHSLQDDIKMKDAKLDILCEQLSEVRDIYTSFSETAKDYTTMKNEGNFFGKRTPLEVYREAAIAHQTHNTYLHLQMRRLEKETREQERINSGTISRLRNDLETRTHRYYMSLKKPSGDETSQNTEELINQLELIKKKYFISLAVAGKLQQCLAGRRCNLDAAELYHRAIERYIVDPELWPQWIAEQVSQYVE